jgi:hypothetical protein
VTLKKQRADFQKQHADFKKHHTVLPKTPHCFTQNTTLFHPKHRSVWLQRLWYLPSDTTVSEVGNHTVWGRGVCCFFESLRSLR